MLLSCKPKVNLADPSKNTALHLACEKGNPLIIRALLAHGSDIGDELYLKTLLSFLSVIHTPFQLKTLSMVWAKNHGKWFETGKATKTLCSSWLLILRKHWR